MEPAWFACFSCSRDGSGLGLSLSLIPAHLHSHVFLRRYDSEMVAAALTSCHIQVHLINSVSSLEKLWGSDWPNGWPKLWPHLCYFCRFPSHLRTKSASSAPSRRYMNGDRYSSDVAAGAVTALQRTRTRKYTTYTQHIIYIICYRYTLHIWCII